MATNNVTNNYSPLTTKGDIYAYDTSASRFPVGSNGKLIFTNSSASFGMNYDYFDFLKQYNYVCANDYSNGGAAEGSASNSTGGTGANAGISNVAFTDGNQIGIGYIATGTTTTGFASTSLNGASINLNSGSGELSFETRVYMEDLSDGTDTYTVNFGFMPVNRTTIDQNNSIYFSYSNGINSGKFLGNCRSGATPSTVDLGTTVVADTWYTLKFVINSTNTLISFYVNGTLGGTLNSNIPATSIGQVPVNIVLKSAGTNDRRIYIDWIKVRKDFSTPRT